ncbi:MAG: type 1 glutamine amidotransferase [Planctomycetota bacterium]|jgi:GMP synthase-like glutamine amidotransferase
MILAIQNCKIETFGLFEQQLEQQGYDPTVLHAYKDEPFPSVKDVEAVLVGGTPIAAYEAHQHDFLVKESDFLKEVIAAGKPCLGVCFGAQLLAQLLGAGVRKNDRKEIGVSEVRLKKHGMKDSVLKGFPHRFPVFQWHSDTFDIPSGGLHLAKSKVCKNQMFRKEKVIGVQFHVEVLPAEAAHWAYMYEKELKAFGKTRSQIEKECRAIELNMEQLAIRLLNNFLSLIGS